MKHVDAPPSVCIRSVCTSVQPNGSFAGGSTLISTDEGSTPRFAKAFFTATQRRCAGFRSKSMTKDSGNPCVKVMKTDSSGILLAMAPIAFSSASPKHVETAKQTTTSGAMASSLASNSETKSPWMNSTSGLITPSGSWASWYFAAAAVEALLRHCMHSTPTTFWKGCNNPAAMQALPAPLPKSRKMPLLSKRGPWSRFTLFRSWCIVGTSSSL
mmetsp:Transcript_31714/g.64156  ORF Transcript_31714/g.64156 Transcript_31714/m.64156 type:complete len:214 (-) Transcript_31714:130-771(-)